MTYAERLAEFVKVTGHKPGEMNKQIPGFPATQAEVDLYLPLFPGTSPKYSEMNRKDYEPTGSESSRITASPQRDEALHSVSLEPSRQSAGPGEMNKPVEVVTCRHRAAYKGPACSACVAVDAGPGRCNRFTRVGALGDPSPCKLPANHEGPREP